MAKLLFFGRVRESVGHGDEVVVIAPEVRNVADLIDWLTARGEPYASALADRRRLRAAVDGVFAGMDAPVSAAREIALFPPVTGG